MEKPEYLLSMLLIAPTLLAFANWAVSLFVMRRQKDYMRADLRQLWSDSLPFLKTQWHIVAIAIATAAWFQLTPTPELTDNPNFAAESFIGVFASAGINWILGLFYVTYLAAPKYPGRVATIGFCSLAMYVIGDTMVTTLGMLGTALFVVPGLIIFVRSCLFLPIFATHKPNPLTAIRQSWTLTKNNYWLVSRYLGLPAVIVLALNSFPAIEGILTESDFQHASLSWQAFMVSTTAIAQGCSFIMCGLLYKLYDRLSTEEQQTII